MYAPDVGSVKCCPVILTSGNSFLVPLTIENGGGGGRISRPEGRLLTPPCTSPRQTARGRPSPPAGARRAPAAGTAPLRRPPRWSPPRLHPDTSRGAARRGR